MASTVVYDLVIFVPVINPLAVEPFPLKIDVPPPLSPPSPQHGPPPLPPPLPTEPLPLIAPPTPPSDLVTDKEDDIVARCHKNKWN